MCVVSMIGDHYQGKWEKFPLPAGPYPVIDPSVAEIIQLRKEVEEMKELLRKAHLYDKETGQEDCKNDEKIAFLKKIAEFVGVDIDEVFK